MQRAAEDGSARHDARYMTVKLQEGYEPAKHTEVSRLKEPSNEVPYKETKDDGRMWETTRC